jgi:electron transfer flavoprotein alpha subunit
MAGVLVLAETRRGELRDVSLELITAGRGIASALGCPLKVAVVDSEPHRFTAALTCDEVDEVIVVPSPSEHFEAHVLERAAAELVEREQPSVVITGFTIDAMGWAPALAAARGLGFASDVTAARVEDGEMVVRREFYGGKVTVELDFPDKPGVVVMMRPGACEPAAIGGTATVTEVPFGSDGAARTEHLGFREVERGDVDITTAEFLLSIGRGVEKQEDVAQFEELADKLGATISASRPLVDAGWMPSSRQVGQSGRTVKPKVYLALGISGAVQHLAGIRDAGTIIAVNTDPDAPIFGVAQYGAVADMFEVAEALLTQWE